MLEISNLTAAYDRTDVLHNVELVIGDGEFVSVVGANTAGKSTLLRSISRLVPKMSGSITFNGIELTRLPAHGVPALGIAHVPEDRHVFGDSSVSDNLLVGAFRRRDKLGVDDSLAFVYGLFPRLKERRTQSAGTLSGGEQQMLAVGRALMLDPKLLILDEPSHGLAPKVAEELTAALIDIHRRGVSILLVEQNVALALSVAQRGYVLQSGRIVMQGSAAELTANDQVRTAYIGI
jgi:branched-chain amino acid transport system ATP-binding protein